VRRHPLVAFVVVLAALFLVVDRVAAGVADRVIAGKLQQAEGLTSRPDVAVRHFPLLTQIAAQRYSQVDVTATDVRRGQVIASKVVVHLHGVHVATGELLSRHLTRIPVDRADGSVTMSYGDIDRMLRDQGITVAYDSGELLAVSGRLDVNGRQLPASGTATVRVDGDQLVVTAQSVDVGGGPVVNQALSTLARGRLSFRLLLADLPFGIHVDRVAVGRAGVTAHASSAGFVIQVGDLTGVTEP
jgi:LmeA-like phospholipid-binding